MLRQHNFYVYHEGDTIYARMMDRSPVIVEKAKSVQEAYDKVQQIVNPKGLQASYFGPEGFLSDKFQREISTNCEKIVREAYANTRAGSN